MENNSELQISLRRNQNTLIVIGTGVIVFGVWSILKAALSAGLQMEGMFADADPSLDRGLLLAAFWISFAVILSADLGLRLYVGLSAVKEGHGAKRRAGYIVLALLMALFSAAAFAISIYALGREAADSAGSLVVSVVVELTSGICLVEMALSAIRVRRLRRKLEEEAR